MTLTELVLGMVITAIILSAVATLSFALGTAKTTTDNLNENQTEIRLALIRLDELIGNSIIVRKTVSGSIALWTGDENGNNALDGSEVAYIKDDSQNSRITIITYPDSFATVSNIDNILNGTVLGSQKKTVLIDDCININFSVTDNQLVNINFDHYLDGQLIPYSFSTKLRASAEYLIDPFTGQIDNTDDDTYYNCYGGI
jgi:hypothetical protein